MDRKYVEGGFIIEQEHLEGRCYVLTGPWSPGCAEAFHREGAQFLRLNRTAGARFEDLTFLKSLRGLRGVEIYDQTVTMKQLPPLLELASLELIGLQCKFKDIDFAASFPQLRFASFQWQRGCESVFRCRSLEFLFMEGYPGRDLMGLAPLSKLKRLHVNSRALVTAEGIAQLVALEHVTFAYCSALVDIAEVAACSSLRVLELYNCKKMNRLPAFDRSSQLRRLTVENGVELESIKPLQPCEKLEEVYLPGTKIADRDVSPLLALPSLRSVAFPRNKAYTPSMDEVNQLLAARR